MTFFINNRKYEKSWSEIFFDLWDLAKGNFEKEMQRKRRLALKKLAAFLILIFGVIYFLSGVVQLLKFWLGESGWAAELIIGFLMLVVGIFMGKSNNN